MKEKEHKGKNKKKILLIAGIVLLGLIVLRLTYYPVTLTAEQKQSVEDQVSKISMIASDGEVYFCDHLNFWGMKKLKNDRLEIYAWRAANQLWIADTGEIICTTDQGSETVIHAHKKGEQIIVDDKYWFVPVDGEQYDELRKQFPLLIRMFICGRRSDRYEKADIEKAKEYFNTRSKTQTSD